MSNEVEFYTSEVLRKSDAQEDRIDGQLYDLLSFLPDGFFVKQIRGTNIYNLYYALATELADAKTEIEDTKDDLYPMTGRTDKLYNRHGVYMRMSKLFEQPWDDYSHENGIQGYRQGLVLMQEAAVNGGTRLALRRVGHAITGIAPLIREYYEYPRWVLSVESGTITSMSGSKYQITDNTKTWIPNEWQNQYIQIKNNFIPWLIPGETSSWNEKDDYPINVEGNQCVQLNGYIYSVGGLTAATASNKVYRAKLYTDGTIGAWEEQEDLPYAMGGYSGVLIVNNRIYVMGGRNISSVSHDKVYRSNAIGSDGEITSWTSCTDLPDNLSGFGCIANGTTIFIIGGADGSGSPVDTIYKTTVQADGSLSLWVAGGSLPRLITTTVKEYFRSIRG